MDQPIIYISLRKFLQDIQEKKIPVDFLSNSGSYLVAPCFPKSVDEILMCYGVDISNKVKKTMLKAEKEGRLVYKTSKMWEKSPSALDLARKLFPKIPNVKIYNENNFWEALIKYLSTQGEARG